MKTKDGINMWGRLQIVEHRQDGDVTVLDEGNLIVDVGKIAVLTSLTTDSTNYISEIAIGNDGTAGPDATDFALSNEIDSKAFASSSIDIANKIVEFRATFTSGDYTPGDFSPEEISEAALKMSDGIIFSRKVFNARPFLIVDNVAMTFIWSIGVA